MTAQEAILCLFIFLRFNVEDLLVRLFFTRHEHVIPSFSIFLILGFSLSLIFSLSKNALWHTDTTLTPLDKIIVLCLNIPPLQVKPGYLWPLLILAECIPTCNSAPNSSMGFLALAHVFPSHTKITHVSRPLRKHLKVID